MQDRVRCAYLDGYECEWPVEGEFWEMFRYYASKQRIQLPLAMTIDTIVIVLTLKLILEYIIVLEILSNYGESIVCNCGTYL